MPTEHIMVTLPIGLRDRAHNVGINISGVAASAVLRTTLAIEKETGANLPGPTPAIHSERGTS